ncbi:helix-turn-helix domain-containing protein [Fibrella aestuarina]|uniref:helix-turn-helix domain-containing protein n=1 Tax=Fibrella aestuarina TaxID=651143 RepID=UPI00059E87D0|nr:helix-turn-helix transcriptional regulator [Fibrella aestuarina]
MHISQSSDIKVKVGALIRSAREKRQLTLKELADLVNSSESVMSRYENGKVNASLNMLQKIAEVLGADLDVHIDLKEII